MKETEAKYTLTDLERLQRRTRTTADMSWLPFMVFGSLVVLSAPFTQVWDGAGEGVYWLVAGPVGLAITWRIFWEREERVGVVDRNAYVYAAIIAAMVLGAIVVGWVLGISGTLSHVGPLYPIAGGLIAIGALRRSVPIAASGLAIGAWGTTVLISGLTEPAIWAVGGEGLILVATGGALLASASRQGGVRDAMGLDMAATGER